MIRCPECESTEPEVTCHTPAVATLVTEVLLTDELVGVGSVDQTEADIEIDDTDRDAAKWYCECGFITDDPDDFHADDPEEE